VKVVTHPEPEFTVSKTKSLNDRMEALTGEKPVEEAPKLNKSELIRKAVDAGFDKPKDGCTYIKEQWDVEIDPQVYSQTKSKYLKDKEAGTQVGTGNPGRPSPNPFSLLSPPTTRPFAGPTMSTDNSMELAEAVKVLIRSYGAENVLRAVRLFTE
jgi:hypothetical protein